MLPSQQLKQKREQDKLCAMLQPVQRGSNHTKVGSGSKSTAMISLGMRASRRELLGDKGCSVKTITTNEED